MSREAKNIQLATEVIEELPYQERVAIAYGIPLPPNSQFVNFVNSASGESEDYETSVNGAWKELNDNPMMDFDGGFDFSDDEFDNFLTKKARARAKRKRELKKQLKAQGIKGKEKRKTARKQALKEIPKDKVKDIAKRTLQNIGRGVAITTLAIPRASFISLMAINFRGIAWKLWEGISNPKYKNTYRKKIFEKWHKLGGNKKIFIKTIKGGAKKKPFLCGAKCKRKLAEKGAKRRRFDGQEAKDIAKELMRNVEFINPNKDSFDGSMYSHATGVDDAAVAVWVGLGSAVIGAMGTIVGSMQMKKSKEKELATQKAIADKEIALMDEKTKRDADLIEKQLRLQADPIRQITSNPNLTQAQKEEAIKQVQEATKVEQEGKLKKYIIIGGAILVGLIVLAKVFKKKN